MATSRRVDGPTPNGGDYSEVYFLTNDDVLTDESRATKAEVVEYTTGGKLVHRTYMTIGEETQ